MKYLIVSDIHGDAKSANFIVEAFNKYKCSGIVCLGDILYHGPRNNLPNDYAPKEVIKILNPISKNKFIAIKGNCDAEVDEMVLDFPLFRHLDLTINDLTVHLEHGHHLDEYKGDAKIVLYGHTHVSKIEIKNNQVFINPGSITLPKENTKRSLIIWDEHKIKLIDMNYNEVILYEY